MSDIKAVFPAQCPCGHIYLESYKWEKIQPSGIIGFVWCGFCRTRVNVYPLEATQ